MRKISRPNRLENNIVIQKCTLKLPVFIRDAVEPTSSAFRQVIEGSIGLCGQDILSLALRFKRHEMFLKVTQHRARVIGNDSVLLQWPSHVDNLASVLAQVFLHNGAGWFGVRADVSVKSAKSGRLTVDLSLHVGISSPGSDR